MNGVVHCGNAVTRHDNLTHNYQNDTKTCHSSHLLLDCHVMQFLYFDHTIHGILYHSSTL